MPELFGRKYQLDVGSFTYKTDGVQYPLQVWFEIESGFDGINSTAEIRIYGLRKSDRDAIKSLANDPRKSESFKKFNDVKLQAGYEGLFGVIFSGKLINAVEMVDLPDRYIILYCQDSADKYINSVYSKTHADGSSVESVILDAAKSMGLPVRVVGDISEFGNVESGLTEFGNTSDVLSRLAREYKFTWTVSDETVVIITETNKTTADVITLSPATGMVGSPEIDYVGVDVTYKLNPELKIGSQFKIDSLGTSFNFSDVYYRNVPENNIDGTFTARKISYSGDFYGDAWEMKVRGFIDE